MIGKLRLAEYGPGLNRFRGRRMVAHYPLHAPAEDVAKCRVGTWLAGIGCGQNLWRQVPLRQEYGALLAHTQVLASPPTVEAAGPGNLMLALSERISFPCCDSHVQP